MTNLGERLLATARDETQSNAALLQEAADELGRLREEYTKLTAKVNHYQSYGEAEF